MKKQNKLEIVGFIILAIGGILFLIYKYFKVEFLNPIMEFKEIILYSGLAIWALDLSWNQKRLLQEFNTYRILSKAIPSTKSFPKKTFR